MPDVSILVPTYNGARHIAPAIASALAQTGVELEVVVADDGSADGTVDIVTGMVDPRIRILRNHTNLGPEANWNRALAEARGRYIKLLPQDDLLLPGSLASQVRALDEDHADRIALSFGARQIIDGNGKIIAHRRPSGLRGGRVPAARLARACVRRGTNLIGEPGAVLFRRSLAERIGGFDGRQGYVIDLDYWLRLLAHGDAWYDPEPVAAFRVAGGSWSIAIGRDQARQYRAFLDRARDAGLIAPSRFDLALGRANATLNNALRLLFYRLVVR